VRLDLDLTRAMLFLRYRQLQFQLAHLSKKI
jgi:hypothetical protein